MPDSGGNAIQARNEFRVTNATVECHSGYKYGERPLAFSWENQRLEVSEILATWRAPQGPCFRIRAEDDRCFELSYQEAADKWEIRLL